MTQSMQKIDLFESEVNISLWSTEIDRYRTIKASLRQWRHLFIGKNVLDFGAGYGLSMSALAFWGAKFVTGIEPDKDRVTSGVDMLRKAGLFNNTNLIHTTDTKSLPFKDNLFSFVLANGVLEHIPQPRDLYLKEMWRIITPGGYLMINETPNKYFPKEIHTTNLWFNHWLPNNVAYKRAVFFNRFPKERNDWKNSGWRGLWYFEVTKAISNYRNIPEQTRRRHQIFSALGLPASIIDPYPTWIFQKIS